MTLSRRALSLGLFAAFASLHFAPSARSQDELPPPADRPVEFDRDVRPILAGRCLTCHGPETRKGGLRLDSREGLLEGGDLGPAIEVGHSDQSWLIDKVAGLDPTSVMPPKGDRLVGSSRVDLQACKLEYSIVSPK